MRPIWTALIALAVVGGLLFAFVRFVLPRFKSNNQAPANNVALFEAASATPVATVPATPTPAVTTPSVTPLLFAPSALTPRATVGGTNGGSIPQTGPELSVGALATMATGGYSAARYLRAKRQLHHAARNITIA